MLKRQVLYTGSLNEFVLDVGEHREGDFEELVVGGTPLEVGELGVDGSTQNLAVAVEELIVQIAEGLDFGGANEGEILGVEEDNAPLALEAVAVDGLEVILGDLSVNVVKIASLKCG